MENTIRLTKTKYIDFKPKTNTFTFDQADFIKCYGQDAWNELNEKGYYNEVIGDNVLVQAHLEIFNDNGDQINFHALKLGFEEFYKIWSKAYPSKMSKSVIKELFWEDFLLNKNETLNEYCKKTEVA